MKKAGCVNNSAWFAQVIKFDFLFSKQVWIFIKHKEHEISCFLVFGNQRDFHMNNFLTEILSVLM